MEHLSGWIEPSNVLWTSALNGHGVSDLLSRIRELLGEDISELENGVVVNKRHQELLYGVREGLIRARKALDEQLGDDCISADLRYAGALLDEILGISAPEELLHKIFSRFCIGK